MNEINFVVKLKKNTTKDFDNLRKYYPLCIHREPQKLVDIFLSATSSKLTDYNAVCNSDLEQNVMCDAINFTHVTQLMFLHHLIKFESAKMHANTKLVFYC